jgi:3-oxoacyl-[acyl-carrier-protein] synthase-1
MVTSVGLTAPAACAAIRAGLANPVESRFADAAGEWITTHAVPWESALRGRGKLVVLARRAIEECLEGFSPRECTAIPLLLCVAETQRPGRLDGLDDSLFTELETSLGALFASSSAIIARGRVAGAVALLHARKLVYEGGVPRVLIAGTDSLLVCETLSEFERQQRLLTSQNSNGFIPAEGAAALLVGRPSGTASLHVESMGFSMEAAHIGTEKPLRADGLSAAIRSALAEGGRQLHELDFRITDLSGEKYYFKEAALALARTLKQPKEQFDLWHPAECVGELGSAILPIQIAVADAACRKHYAPGESILIHAGTDEGHRAALIAHYASR